MFNFARKSAGWKLRKRRAAPIISTVIKINGKIMTILRTIIFIGMALFSSISYSYTECIRPIANVWTSLNSDTSVWITFTDGGSPVYKNESQLTEGQMNRLISFALTAQSAGKNLQVRYPEDGLSCPPVGAARNDIEGFWVLK